MSDAERTSGVEAATKPRIRLRVVSDYICPWCFVGLRRAERLADEFDVEFDAHAYNLRPGMPAEGLPRDELYRDRKFPAGYLDHLRQTARESGIEMIAPPVVPNTFKAHEATEFAKEHGRLAEFHHAVFSAYWERGENIGLEDVLCGITEACGLDPEGLREALAGHRYADEVERQMAWSREAGVGGVPTFVFSAVGGSASGGEERFAVVGAQEYDVFAGVARRIASGALSTDR